MIPRINCHLPTAAADVDDGDEDGEDEDGVDDDDCCVDDDGWKVLEGCRTLEVSGGETVPLLAEVVESV